MFLFRNLQEQKPLSSRKRTTRWICTPPILKVGFWERQEYHNNQSLLKLPRITSINLAQQHRLVCYQPLNPPHRYRRLALIRRVYRKQLGTLRLWHYYHLPHSRLVIRLGPILRPQGRQPLIWTGLPQAARFALEQLGSSIRMPSNMLITRTQCGKLGSTTPL